MPQFRFRAMARSGEIVAGEVEAPSREEVVSRVEYLGHMLIDAELAPKGGFLTKETNSREKRPRSRDVTLFLRQLSLLTAAGLTLEASLQTLAEDSNKSLVWFANNLRSTITAADSFAERSSANRPSSDLPMWLWSGQAKLRGGRRVRRRQQYLAFA